MEHPLIVEASMIARVLHLDPVAHLSAPPFHRAVRVATALQISQQKEREAAEMRSQMKK